MTDLEAYLVPLILVMLTGTVLLYPALSTAIVEAGNVTIELLGTFNDVNKSINRNFDFNAAIPAFNMSFYSWPIFSQDN